MKNHIGMVPKLELSQSCFDGRTYDQGNLWPYYGIILMNSDLQNVSPKIHFCLLTKGLCPQSFIAMWKICLSKNDVIEILLLVYIPIRSRCSSYVAT